MKSSSTLLVIFLLTSEILLGQSKLPIKVFHRHDQLCHFIGFTLEDYVIKLFDDSTINIVRYTNRSYRSITKSIYTGRYQVKNDSILAENLLCHTEVHNRYQKMTKKPLIPSPPITFAIFKAVFVLKNEMIVSTDHLFPDLLTRNLTEAELPEYAFQGFINSARNIPDTRNAEYRKVNPY